MSSYVEQKLRCRIPFLHNIKVDLAKKRVINWNTPTPIIGHRRRQGGQCCTIPRIGVFFCPRNRTASALCFSNRKRKNRHTFDLPSVFLAKLVVLLTI
ncbi:hypothetical protein CEXT_223541 [Caerostris extrusa]|uniref:Uncharacterized protein n=1 Tax=Caerostris extrusa TaxID=172846 RepID=A0AAV4XX57_CAEEX|nr:hypothetical protein CEXT_223541 [Caerostris extrusa]